MTDFFRAETDRAEPRRQLEEQDADWLLIGPPRRAGLSPAQLPLGLTLMYGDGRYRLYGVSE
jgi:hypothetical protein